MCSKLDYQKTEEIQTDWCCFFESEIAKQY